MRIVTKIVSFLTVLIIGFSCVEQIDIETSNDDAVLVVDALITDELKFHEVMLSNSYDLNSENGLAETNASVNISDSNNNSYEFEEVSPGVYRSKQEFKAERNVDYELIINTQSGKEYRSQPSGFRSTSRLDNINVKRETEDDGLDYFNIYASGTISSGDAGYFRYEYEETYKIVAPYWSDSTIAIINDEFPNIEVALVNKNNTLGQVCYGFNSSNDIIQVETMGLNNDVINDFRVRSVSIANPIVSHRYSILVKQYSQSLEAYNYFSTLKKLSLNESVFSNSQPGFLKGNLYGATDESNKVIGYFEVSSVSSKRLFFNFLEYYPEHFMRYFVDCTIEAPAIIDDRTVSSPLIDLIRSNDMTFYDINPSPSESLPGPFLIVNKDCGDCSAFGTTERPSYWID